MMAFVQSLSQLLPTLIVLGLTALACLRALRPYIKNVKLAAGMDVAERLVSAAVANAEQLIVRPAKDPTQPGAWNANEAAKTKQGVIDQVANTNPGMIETLRSAGIAWPRELLGQLVEKEVLRQKAASTLPVSIAVTSVPPPSAVNEGNKPCP